VSTKKFNIANYTAGEDPYESPPPEDEFDSLVIFRSKKPVSVYITSNSVVSSLGVSNTMTLDVRRARPTSLSKHKPKHSNYSPNNIRVIESRSTFTL